MDIGRKLSSEEPGGPYSASSLKMVGQKTAPYVFWGGWGWREEARERGVSQLAKEGRAC